MESAHGSAEDSQTSLSNKANNGDLEDVEAVDDVNDVIDAEETSEKEDDNSEQHEETLIERLDLLRSNNPFRDLDERAHVVRKNIKEKFKNTPKSVLDEAKENKPQIEKRLEQNDRELSDLMAFGYELISNVKVANEKRELLRREYETQQRVELENGISKEATEAMARYNDIVARWSELGAIEEPLIVFQKMEAQSDAVIELMRNKDDMLAKCQSEIDRMDANFEELLMKQQMEICSMVERVNAQINLMESAYGHRLDLLADTLESERQTVAFKEQEKWKQFYETAQHNELYKLEMTREKKLFYSEEIRRITTQQEEITRSTRIRLEKESEMLLHELRSKKNQMLINSEKLDYNYQVLQKRNEENVIINNQQKRRVGRLNEALVSMKKRIKAAETAEENTINKLANDIQKLHDSITDLEKKNESFQIHNRKKFVRVWDTNFQEVKSLIERVYDIDRILHEQQLALPWQKPELSLEEFDLVKLEKAALFGGLQSPASEPNAGLGVVRDNCENAKNQIAVFNSSASARSKAEQVFRRHQRDTLIRKAEKEQKREEERIDKRLLRNILRKIATRCEFLVEDRLLAFLEPYTETHKTLVRLDNIFAALRINDMAAVNRLVEFFKPYSWCPNCMKGTPSEQLKKLYHPCAGLNSSVENDEIFNDSDDNESDEVTMCTSKAITSNLDTSNYESRLSINSETATPCNKHYLLIEPAMVLTALSEFTNQETKIFEEESKRHQTLHSSKAISAKKSKLDISLTDINDNAVCEYWRKFLNYMPEEKFKLWQSLEHGLLHYLNVLKQRDQLDKDCIKLRQQNSELKHLLKKFKVE